MLENSHSGLFSDLWALGCIIYELITGQRMFKAKNNHEVFNKILEFDVNFPFNMDKDAIDLVKKLCNLDPYQRLGYNKNFNAIKKHSFFKGVDFE